MPKVQAKKSQKHSFITKANSAIFASVALCSIVIVFSFFATRALMSQSSYHTKVISEKKKVLSQVEQNGRNADNLLLSYQAFSSEIVNVLNGSIDGGGPLDGDNPKIVLDALPSSYDFPGLISSIEKILVEGGYGIESIGGSEPEDPSAGLTQTDPEPLPIFVPITVRTTYQNAQLLNDIFERSIRPFHLERMTISGTDSDIRLTMMLQTYFQPEKIFDISTRVIR